MALDWEQFAEEATAQLVAVMEPVARRAADDIYERLMETAQDYLAENISFNLASRLQTAEREAATQRMAAYAASQQIGALVPALERIVHVVRAAGVNNLARAVELGQVSWAVKMNDALEAADAALPTKDGEAS